MARVDLNFNEIRRTSQRAAFPLVHKTTKQILNGAQRLVREGSHESGSGKRSPGPTLKASLQEKYIFTETSITGMVLTRKKYALTVHDGSKAHTIRSKGRLLTFRWPRGDASPRLRHRRHASGMYTFTMVRHPGNKRPNSFLTTPLRLYGRTNGFHVFTSRGQVRTRLP